MVERSPDGASFPIEEVMKAIDKDREAPDKRALRVYDYLQRSGKFSNWDVLCFCVEYIGSMAGTLEWLQEPARHILRLVYLAHYVRFGDHEWLDKAILSGGQLRKKTE